MAAGLARIGAKNAQFESGPAFGIGEIHGDG